jgi:alpha-beta hydrolase superfamily lysophospholipase
MGYKIFIHGLESSNRGTKSIFFKERYPEMIIPHFRGALEERMEKLQEVLTGQSGIRMVGSSFGGLMATLFAIKNRSRVERLILLAPALNLMPYTDHQNRTLSLPVSLYHGTADDVIPFNEIEPIAREIFPDLSLHCVDDDHFLHKTFKDIDWDQLLN